MIETTLGPRDESTLTKSSGTIDNDIETTTWVEYCLANCPGQAHQTGDPDEVHLFCAHHIHRSVHVTLKQGVELFSEIGEFK